MDVNVVAEKFVLLHQEYIEPGCESVPVTGGTRPLADLDGFDSDFIPEIVRRAARELGVPFKKGTRVSNIYVDHGRKLNILEIARKFIEKYVRKGAKP